MIVPVEISWPSGMRIVSPQVMGSPVGEGANVTRTASRSIASP
jgi:hypothetical protein